MEDLKMLVDMVANLPQMAIWVIAAFWAYKVIFIGSVFVLIKLFILKLHDFLVSYKAIKCDYTMSCIDKETADALKEQVGRVKDKKFSYIHMSDVFKIRDIIDQIEREKK